MSSLPLLASLSADLEFVTSRAGSKEERGNHEIQKEKWKIKVEWVNENGLHAREFFMFQQMMLWVVRWLEDAS